MRQKFLFFVFLIILSSMCSKAYAQTVEVAALSSFSTENPPQSISVKLVEPLELSETLTLQPGYIMSGDLEGVVSPKRLKRDADFDFKLTSYTDNNGIVHTIDSNIIASYTTAIDKGEVAKSAAVGVGNLFVKGLSMGVAAVSGAVKNEEGNRIKSSAKSVYEASPVSYVGKGEDIEIGMYEPFLLKFPNVKKKKSK